MKKIFVAGHRGMVGAAIARNLEQRDNIEIVTKTRYELDLSNQSEVNDFFAENTIDEVYLASAKVGGIHANNTYPAEFIYEQSTEQAYYFFLTATIDGAALAPEDWVGAFNGETCVGSRSWNTTSQS